MNSTKAAAALVCGLAACGNFNEPSGPSAADNTELSTALKGYDAAAAVVVVNDLLTRVVPTLTSGTGLSALKSRLESLATALLREQWTVLYDRVNAAKQTLKQYSSGAPEAEEPEIEGIEVGLNYVGEGLSAPTDGKRPGR
jgi:hypothetical protein